MDEHNDNESKVEKDEPPGLFGYSRRGSSRGEVNRPLVTNKPDFDAMEHESVLISRCSEDHLHEKNMVSDYGLDIDSNRLGINIQCRGGKGS